MVHGLACHLICWEKLAVIGGPWAGVALIVKLTGPVGRSRLAAKWPAVSRCRSMLCRFPNEVVMVAMVQVRRPSAGQAYYRRKPAEGESPKEALRWLKRRLSDAVYRCLLADQHLRVSPVGSGSP